MRERTRKEEVKDVTIPYFLQVTNSLLARDVLIAEFLVLEEYARQPIKKYNDIGLIRLQEEVHATIYIKPACLWTGFLGNDWVANITGWGKTTNTEGIFFSTVFQNSWIRNPL